ncbi:MAG: hypothetical protein ACLQL2_06380 [Methylovirgula sp.]
MFENNTLIRLFEALDPILKIVPQRRQLSHHREDPIGPQKVPQVRIKQHGLSPLIKMSSILACHRESPLRPKSGNAFVWDNGIGLPSPDLRSLLVNMLGKLRQEAPIGALIYFPI